MGTINKGGKGMIKAVYGNGKDVVMELQGTYKGIVRQP